MTKDFCDHCHKEIDQKSGPIYFGGPHAVQVDCFCKTCIVNDKTFTMIRSMIFKKIEKHHRLFSRLA